MHKIFGEYASIPYVGNWQKLSAPTILLKDYCQCASFSKGRHARSHITGVVAKEELSAKLHARGLSKQS